MRFPVAFQRSRCGTSSIAAWLTLSLLIGAASACSRATNTSSDDVAVDRRRAAAAGSTFLLGGIQVHEATLDGWLDALQASGMNTVAVTDYAHQGDWDTASLWWDPNPDLLVEIRGAKARGMHVVLVLRLALDRAFARNRFLWHGMIMPQTDEQIRLWFARYETFVQHWAEIAEREGIDALMLGSELNTMASTVPIDAVPALEDWFLDDKKQLARRARAVILAESVAAEHLWQNGEEVFDDVGSYLDSRIAAERGWAAAQTSEDSAEATITRQNARRALLETHWLRLIECIRGVYHGRLGYAANFDQYMQVSFWDQLDIIGINAYFKLRDHLVPEEDDDALAFALEQGWRQVLGEIDSFRAEWGLENPVMFTEMGFTTRRNSTIETWADTGFAQVRRARDAEADDTRLLVWRQQPVDLDERATAVAALDRVYREARFPLQGILWWKLSSHAYHQPHESFLVLLDPALPDPVLPILRRFVAAEQ